MIVSHSAQIAEGVRELALQMAGDGVQIGAAGGLADDGGEMVLGTDAGRIATTVQSLCGAEGVLLLVDIGSAGLSAEARQEIPAVTATTALRMDADAVAVSIFFGRGGEPYLMQWLGELIEQCGGLGLPVLAEMMPPPDHFYAPEQVAHAARIGMELGADIVKTNYCGNPAAVEQVVAATSVPIIVAGGPSAGGVDNTLEVAREAVAAGAAGVAFGRRVWQASDPESVVRGLRDVVFSTKRGD